MIEKLPQVMSRRPFISGSLAVDQPRLMEQLEQRTLMAATLNQAFADAVQAINPASETIDLNTRFSDPDISGTLVRLDTNGGNIDVELFDDATPLTVNNWLQYVTSGLYDDTFFHRSIDNFIIQGGGYNVSSINPANHISTFGPVQNEFSTTRSNLPNTIAMAKVGGNPNSATSEFFFNTADNSQNLDNQNGGFTVFGRVVNGTSSTLDAIEGLSEFNASGFSNIPLIGGAPATPNNVVKIETARVVPTLTFTVNSSNPDVVGATLNGSNLILTYGADRSGSSDVTITATDSTGRTVTDTFNIELGLVDVNLGRGGAKEVRYVDADGTQVKLKLKSAAAVLRFGGVNVATTTAKGITTVTGSNLQLDETTISGGGSKTELKITAKGGDKRFALGNVVSNTKMKKLLASSANIFGSVSVNGNLSEGSFASLTGDRFQAGSISKLTVKGAVDTDLTASRLSNTSVGDVTGGTWTVAGKGGKLTVNSISDDSALVFANDVTDLQVKGDLNGDVQARTFKNINVRGGLNVAVINATRTVAERGKGIEKLTVKGAVNLSAIVASGNVGKIQVGSMSQSTIFAGVTAQELGTFLPASPLDFVAIAKIDSITVKNRGVNYVSSGIAAASLGKIKLGTVLTDNSGVPFGVSTDRISQIEGTTAAGQKFKFKNLNDPTAATATIAASGVNFGDAQITLL